MVITYTNIFHCKTLQNLPKFGFWFENIPSGNPGQEDFENKNIFFLALYVGVNSKVVESAPGANVHRSRNSLSVSIEDFYAGMFKKTP
jgi:hypothetical protein